MPSTQPPPLVVLADGVALPIAFFERSSTATSLLREDGLLLFRNAAAARIFTRMPPGVEDMIGHNITELEPRAFFEERVRMMRRLAIEERDAVFRDIWEGNQIMTHVHLLPPQPGEGMRLFLLMHLPTAGAVSPAPDDDVLFHDPAHQDLGPLALLSPRELEVLALVGEGLTAAQMAAKLHRSEETINTHKASLLRKLNCQNAVQLAVIAHRAGLKFDDGSRFASRGR